MAKRPSAVEEIIEEERVPAVRPSVGVALWLNKFIVNTRNLRLVLLVMFVSQIIYLTKCGFCSM